MINLKTNVIVIAQILKVTEDQVMQALIDAFENTSDEVDRILDDTQEKLKEK